MLDYICKIGIFMVAARAVVHFAPGKQYERYIKSVAGIIVLVLFLEPFLQLFGVQWEGPQDVLERMEELTDMPDISDIPEVESSLDSALRKKMEEEVREALNRDMEGEEYGVREVAIRLELDSEADNAVRLSAVEVSIAKKDAGGGERRIAVDEIVIGEGQEAVSGELLFAYRERFAKLLGIETEKVEVRQDGGGKKTF